MKAKLVVMLTVFLSVALVCCSKTEDFSKDQANAYFLVFEKLYETDTGLNGGKCIAVDLSKAKLSDTKPLITLMQNFCDSHGYMLLLDTYNGLQQKGFIKDMHFADGVLYSFSDIQLTQDVLVTTAQKWRSGTGAIGSDFTVSKNKDVWEIKQITNSWIS